MTPEQRNAVLEILDQTNDITIATVRPDGYPQATTVSFVHDGLNIYFGCGVDSQKARNIRHSNKVSLAANLPYRDWNDIRGLSLGGRAQFVKNPDQVARMLQTMKERFPQIEDFAATSDVGEMALVRIVPVVISLLDYRKGFGHTEQAVLDGSE